MKSESDKSMTLREMQSKGGRTTVKRKGKKFMREIGKKGAASLLSKRGKDYMRKLGRKGAKKRHGKGS